MRILCFGDSNTYGYDPRSYFGEPYSEPWPEVFSKKSGYQVFNAGQNGREIPPMIFDETFAAIDCGRLALAMDAMGSASVQSLLFTCRADEGRIAADRGYRVIPM